MNLPSRSAARVRLSLSVLVTAVSSACSSDFGPTPIVRLTLTAIDWPAVLLVGDTTSIEVAIRDEDGRRVGTALEWSADPTEAVVLTPIEQANGSVAPARAHVLGLATGAVEIVVRVPEGGQFAPGELRRQLTVHMQWSSVSAGYEHACGVTWDQRAYCWGAIGMEFSGLLGDGASAGSAAPSAVVGDFSFVATSAGDGHTCGIVRGGRVICWGLNFWGAVGNGTTQDQLAPVGLSGGPSWSTVSAGRGFTCGVSLGGTGVCVGLNDDAQLGAPAVTETCDGRSCSRVPVVVTVAGSIATDFVDISAGERSACGVVQAGTAYCWGDNGLGTLGNPLVLRSDTAVAVAGTESFRSVSVGRHHACGITTGDRAFCWGTNRFGELGVGEQALSGLCGSLSCARQPLPVSGDLAFATVSVRDRGTCGVLIDGRGFCWGKNDHGQIGAPSAGICSGEPCARVPVEIPELRFSVIGVGERFTCGVTVDGSTFCWGRGTNGQLGSGLVDRATPRRVSDPTPR